MAILILDDANIMECDKELLTKNLADIEEVYTIRVTGNYGELQTTLDAGEGLIFVHELDLPEDIVLYTIGCQDVLREFKK